ILTAESKSPFTHAGYHAMTDNILTRLTRLLPRNSFSVHPDHLNVVAGDESTLERQLPLAVVWADSPEQISKVVKLCAETGTPVPVRGAGSALEGSTIPLQDGLVLDVSRLTAIVNYWPDDLQVEVEPGLIYDNLNLQLKRDGLFFPPSPGGSGDLATI